MVDSRKSLTEKLGASSAARRLRRAGARSRFGIAGLVVTAVTLLGLSACAAAGGVPAASRSGSATVSATTAAGSSTGSAAAGGDTAATADALRAYDWSSVALSAASCDAAATGDLTLKGGKGTVVVDAQTQYRVSAQLPPDVGELGGHAAAVLRYSCILDGSNGVGAFPVAVFTAGASGPQLVGVLQNADLGTAPGGEALTHDAVTFVDGQVVISGKYLTPTDANCCPSGQGWTSIALAGGRLIASGVVTSGAPPTTLASSAGPGLPTGGGAVGSSPIVYSPPVQVQTQQDLTRLTGAPADFQAFIWSLVQSSTSTDCAAVISVDRLNLTGFAEGGSGCSGEGSGSGMLWYKDGATWKVLAELQNEPTCALLESVHFAADALDDPSCFDANDQSVPYAG
ncbi:hypothetical protein [Subtercola sp. YIM 133946]|uniref:hypothetical protein n=1 Tax=Subtercola sp. YIM 133946 TaxID=3118909 RepID=UPI002F93018B